MLGFLESFLASSGVFVAEPEAEGRRPVTFAAGVASAGALKRLLAAGIPPGLDLARLAGPKGAQLRAAVQGLAGVAMPVLVDLQAEPDEENRSVLSEMADQLAAQLHIALPSGVDQAETLARLTGMLLDLRRMADGIQLLMPVQDGILAPDELQSEVQSLLGRQVIPSFDTAVWQVDAIEAFVQATAPTHLHLVGGSGRRERLKLVRRIWEESSGVAISELRQLRGEVWPEHPDAAQFGAVLPAALTRRADQLMLCGA